MKACPRERSINYVNTSKSHSSRPEPPDSRKTSTGVSPHQGEAWQRFGYKTKAAYDQAMLDGNARADRRAQALVDNLNRKTASE